MADARSLERATVFAEEDFVVEAQTFLHQLMLEKDMSRADLARAMGVTRARVTQIFSDECKNFTIRLLARAVVALGEAPELRRKQKEETPNETAEGCIWKAAFYTSDDGERIWDIKDMPAEMGMFVPCNDDTPACLVGHPYSSMEWEAA